MFNTPRFNPQRLDLLRELREAAGLSQEKAAQLCGLMGRQGRLTVGAWEQGKYAPDERRRPKLIGYLWDQLRLRQEPARFAQLWAVLVDEWGWAELSDAEWRELRPGAVPAQKPSAVAPVRAVVETPDHAPFQAPPLIGHWVSRHRCCDQVRTALLTNQPSRLYALVGMGGAGKSTLAIQLAHELRPSWPDGVLWASPSISHPLDILQSWATAYHHDFSTIHDVVSRAVAVRSLLAPKRVLLVLDDVSEPEQGALLLPGGEQCVILLTTRNEETAVALGATVIQIAEFTPDESITLVRHLLGSTRVDAELADSATLCEVLHHLPLAVEIAAQVLKVRTRRRLGDLVAQLAQTQQRLDLRISNRAVRTSFAVSWAGLAPPLRTLFASLAVFEGRSFNVEAVASLVNLPLPAVLDQLDALKALSLVSESGANRYRQHPLLADFAAEQLGERWPRLIGALAVYYLSFCQHHVDSPLALEAEWGNIEALFRHLGQQPLGTIQMELADALSGFWLKGGRHAAARVGYALAAQAAATLGLPQRQATFLIKHGYACAQQNHYDEATALLNEAQHLAQALGEPGLCADALHHLARIAIELSQYEEADQRLSEAAQLRGDTDERGLARLLHLRAILLYRQGSYQQAEQLSQQTLEIHSRYHQPLEMLEWLRLLMDCALATEQNEVAKTFGLKALRLAESSGHRNEYAEVSFTLATVYRRLKQVEQAWTYAEEGRRLFEQMGIQSFVSYTLYEQSKIKFLQRELIQALDLAQRSLSLMETLQDDFNRVYCLLHLGQIQVELNQHQEAQQIWLAGLTLAQSLHHPLVETILAALHKHPL